MSAPGAHLAAAQVIARNIVPLAGILFFGWSAQNVLLVYFAGTMLSLGVLFAGVLRHFAPPISDDGWAARLNGEVGVIGGAAFIALFLAIPLGIPLIFMLGGQLDWRAAIDDPGLRIGLPVQVAAALWSYLDLYRALRTATPDTLRLKRRFALVFLRWIVLVIVAIWGVGFWAGRYGAIVFVVLYAAVSIWAEIAPDHFLRTTSGGREGIEPPVVRPSRAKQKRRR